MTVVEELIARLEKATGPNFALERDLLMKVDTLDQDWSKPPNYTYSIDAALRLLERVLPGWYWRVGHGTEHAGWAHLNRVHPDHCDRKDEATAHAATPALALCLAIVRALKDAP